MLNLIFIILLLSGPAMAQETYSLNASAGNVTTLTGVITGLNGNLCVQYGLPRTCTQSQVCTASNTPGGASCTAAQARTNNVRIFPLTQAGREEFTTHRIAAPKFTELVRDQRNEDRRAFCAGWNAASQLAKDNACSDLGLPAGCNPDC